MIKNRFLAGSLNEPEDHWKLGERCHQETAIWDRVDQEARSQSI
jgi:hypothetical protein